MYARRLFCATRQGMLLFCDISTEQPQVIHSMKMVLQKSVGTNYIKQIEIDLDKKILVLRLKSSSIIVI